MLDVIKSTSDKNVAMDLLSGAEKFNRSDEKIKKVEEVKGWCSSLTKYCRPSHYQKYFDVTTDTVWYRILKAIVPFNKTPIFDSPRVDLYGPIWVIVTLIIVIAIVSHFSNWIDSFFESDEVQVFNID